ncbi:hypothetical protein KBC55_04445 [Patescibacteria group bacterium]|nr:hypothetical protein [Patescibacteria group bacterium]
MKKSTRNLGIIATVLGLSTLLLIGLRFDATFAGGPGFKPHTPFALNDTEVTRGNILTTSDAFAIATHAEATLYLDKNTRLHFDDGREEQLKLTLEDGRMFGDGKFTISSRDTKITINGRATIVHYPWDNTLSVLLFSGTGVMNHKGVETNLSTGGAMSVNTLEKDALPRIVDFSITAPAVVDFYLFVNENDR